MIPTMLPVVSGQGTGEVDPVAIYTTSPIDSVRTADNVAPADNVAVNIMTDVTGHHRDASQDTTASKPFIDVDLADGAYMVRFADTDNLQADTPGGDGDKFFILFASLQSGAQREVVSRDTTATTTKPAYYVRLLSGPRRVVLGQTVGDTAYEVEAELPTTGQVAVECRIDQAADEIGVRVDGGTEVVTATTGTHNAQTGPRVLGGRLVNGAVQNEATEGAIGYLVIFDSIPTGSGLGSARRRAARWAQIGATFNFPVPIPEGGGNITLEYYVSDPSLNGWEIVSAQSMTPGLTANIGVDGQSLDLVMT